MMKDHHDEWTPSWKTTMMKDHPDARPLLFEDHYDERPHSLKTTMMKAFPSFMMMMAIHLQGIKNLQAQHAGCEWNIH